MAACWTQSDKLRLPLLGKGFHADGDGMLIEQAQQAAAAQVARLEGITDNEVWQEVINNLCPHCPWPVLDKRRDRR
jgi:hypothetical protein